MIYVGNRLKCQKRLVNAETYFQGKLEKCEKEWEQLKESSLHENIGVAFVAFKEKDSVLETIDEFEIVKTKLAGKAHYDALQIGNWEIEKAINTQDIIWSELNKGFNKSFPIKIVLAILPLLISIIVISALTYVD